MIRQTEFLIITECFSEQAPCVRGQQATFRRKKHKLNQRPKRVSGVFL